MNRPPVHELLHKVWTWAAFQPGYDDEIKRALSDLQFEISQVEARSLVAPEGIRTPDSRLD